MKNNNCGFWMGVVVVVALNILVKTCHVCAWVWRVLLILKGGREERGEGIYTSSGQWEKGKGMTN